MMTKHGKRTHEALGHQHDDAVTRTTGIKARQEPWFCTPCANNKGTQSKASKPLRTPTSNVWYADLKVITDREDGLASYKYILGIIEAETSWCDLYIMVHKSSAKTCLQEFTNSRKEPFVLRPDAEHVFLDHTLREWLTNKGVLVQHSAPDAHFQIGKIERYWQTLGRMADTMLHSQSPRLWPFAYKHAAFILNRTVRADGLSPIESERGFVPQVQARPISLLKLPIFG